MQQMLTPCHTHAGYDMLQQQQQHAHHQQQQMAAEPALECKGLKRSLSGMQQQGEGSGTLGGGHSRQEAVALKRSRLVWTPELHLRFREAVDRAGGIEAAVPKVVLEVRFQQEFLLFSLWLRAVWHPHRRIFR